jgi:hypothetical protein
MNKGRLDESLKSWIDTCDNTKEREKLRLLGSIYRDSNTNTEDPVVKAVIFLLESLEL